MYCQRVQSHDLLNEMISWQCVRWTHNHCRKKIAIMRQLCPSHCWAMVCGVQSKRAHSKHTMLTTTLILRSMTVWLPWPLHRCTACASAFHIQTKQHRPTNCYVQRKVVKSIWFFFSTAKEQKQLRFSMQWPGNIWTSEKSPHFSLTHWRNHNNIYRCHRTQLCYAMLGYGFFFISRMPTLL